jgi:hypothetical protein
LLGRRIGDTKVEEKRLRERAILRVVCSGRQRQTGPKKTRVERLFFFAPVVNRTDNNERKKMCTSMKGELFNIYRTGRPVSMSTDTMREVQLGCQALSATKVFVEASEQPLAKTEARRVRRVSAGWRDPSSGRRSGVPPVPPAAGLRLTKWTSTGESIQGSSRETDPPSLRTTQCESAISI